MLGLPMVTSDAELLVGTNPWPDVRVEALIRCDAALATYAATSTADGAECTLRVALGVELSPEHDNAIAAALQRLVRHSFGIPSLCAPRAAGPVMLGSGRLLGLAHAGSAYDSAESRIASHAPVPLEELARLLEPIAAALTRLHDQGLVHGAVHPGAVRLIAAGPVLSAFGLSELAMLLGGAAAARDALPARSRVPEQVGIVPAAPSPESDTYALAMIACELLAGRPFTFETEPSSIARAIDHPMLRPSPASLGLALPEPVEKVFLAALNTQPRERLLSPRAFVAALSAPAAAGAHLGASLPAAGHEAHPAPASRILSDRQPIEPKRAPRSAFAPAPAPPPAPPRTDSGAWLVYSLIILGVMLLIGGAATVFVLAQRRVPPAVPIASAPLPLPKPPPPVVAPGPEPSTPEPDPEPPAEPPALAAPSAPASAHPLPASASALYPDDLTALVPLGRETPIIGSRDAWVTIVVFADMQCPHTRKAREELEAVRRRFGADVRIVVRHLPIPSHDKAEEAAELAATTGALAGPQAFWKLFETLTRNQGALSTDDMVQWSQEAGAPAASVRKALEEHVYQRIVEADRATAQRLMVRATPSFFINGTRLDGAQPLSKLTELIDKELAAARAAHASGTPRPRLYSTRVTFNVTSGQADPPRARTAPRR